MSGTLADMKIARGGGIVVAGEREELLTELRRLEVGWRHLVKDDNAREARRGILELLTGASSVRVGHTTYEVTGATERGSLD